MILWLLILSGVLGACGRSYHLVTLHFACRGEETFALKMYHMDNTYFVVSEVNVQMLVSRYVIFYAKWLKSDVNVKK